MTTGSLKLTVLGGGSFFTPSFVGTMCDRAETFAGAEVRLHDLDSERVGLVKAFCERLTQARGVPMTFVDAPDLARSLDGADFVIATFRIGGPAALQLDETIPTRFGYFGNETVGPGGIFMAIRTVPVVLDVAERMTRLCPRAWLVNYANPTNFVGDALRRAGHERSVSLCDGFICPPRDIGISLDIPHKKILTRHAGINHCSWAYRAECDGRDLLAELLAIEPDALDANLSASGLLDEFGAARRRRWLDIFRIMGRYPAPAGHVEPYFYHDEWLAMQKQRRAEGRTYRGEHARKNWDRLRAVLADWDDAAAGEIARTHTGGHADLAIGVADALATGSGEVFPVNVPHGGAVPGFPPETVLELYCAVTRDGFTPEGSVPRFPDALLAQQNHLAAVERLTVSGILEKDRGKLLQAVCIHPFTKSVAVAEELFETMWREERETLGTYWE